MKIALLSFVAFWATTIFLILSWESVKKSLKEIRLKTVLAERRELVRLLGSILIGSVAVGLLTSIGADIGCIELLVRIVIAILMFVVGLKMIAMSYK